MKHEPVELAIIGGGAAGLMAAATAAAAGARCIVIERKARVGAKMLMTANGRCNFTKDVPVERMLEDIGGDVADFAAPALRAFPPQAIVAGFRARGLKTRRMADGRIFPASGNAADVVHVFGDMLRDEAIPLLCNCPVTGIQRVKNGFIVGLGGFTLWARNVLLATGGLSFPKTGSVGDGLEFARALGHCIEPCRAGLTGFECPPHPPARYERAQAAVIAGGVEVFRSAGEVEYETKGVTGAAVYNCSRFVARRNLRDWTLRLETPEGTSELRAPRMRPLKEAIVTIGGVSRGEIDPQTMCSRIVPGLYFAGEVVDIDGPTGGYNLTLAFATARLAVKSMLRNRLAG